MVALGTTIILEKISYKAWQKRFGKSVGLRAPGMFVELLRRTVASTGGILVEIPTRTTALSQWCHGCGKRVKKPLSQRWHHCPCGVGPVQRDLYSAFLAAYLDPADLIPSCAQYQGYWEGAEARLPKSSGELPLEPALLLRGEEREAWAEPLEPPLLSRGELSEEEGLLSPIK